MKLEIKSLSVEVKSKMYGELLALSRKRLLNKYENFLFSLLRADRVKAEGVVYINDELISCTHNISVSQRFLYDNLFKSFRFDDTGKKYQKTEDEEKKKLF